MAPVTLPSMSVVPLPSIYKVGGPSTTAAEGQSFPLPTSGLPIPLSVIEELSTRLAGISIREIDPRVFAVEGQVQVMASQMVHVADKIEQIGTQVEQEQQTATQRDEPGEHIDVVLGMDKCLTNLERRPPGPQ
nr:hypothetical protein [Tanacetum cinerariifolium]